MAYTAQINQIFIIFCNKIKKCSGFTSGNGAVTKRKRSSFFYESLYAPPPQVKTHLSIAEVFNQYCACCFITDEPEIEGKHRFNFEDALLQSITYFNLLLLAVYISLNFCFNLVIFFKLFI